MSIQWKRIVFVIIAGVSFLLSVLCAIYPIVSLFHNTSTNVATASASTSTTLAMQKTTPTLTPFPTPTFTPTPPAYPNNIAFSCQKCPDPSRQILSTLENTTVNKTGGRIDLKIRLENQADQTLYISTMNNQGASFVTLKTPDKDIHKLNNALNGPISIGGDKELSFTFALSVISGPYEIGLQLIDGPDPVVYNSIPFDIQ